MSHGDYQDEVLSLITSLANPSTNNSLLSATTDVSDAGNNIQNLLCDADGHLQVDIVSGGGGGGGDATASNQSLQITEAQSTNTKLNAGLPSALSASGNLKVSIEEGAGGDATASNQTLQLTQATTTNTKLNAGLPSALSASGNLKVSVEEGAGGDASASNQSLQLTQATNTNTKLDTLNGKITQGSDATLTDAQQVLIYGRNGTGALKPIHITNNGDVEVEIADFVKGQDTMSASFPVVISSDQSTINVKIDDIDAGIINPINVSSKHANAYLQLMSNQSITLGNDLTTSAHTLSAGGGGPSNYAKTTTIYVHYGSGTTDTNFSVQVEKSYDGTHYFYDSEFMFSSLGMDTQSPPQMQPAVVASGSTDARFIKVKVSNNSESNTSSVNVYVIERQ